MVIIEKKPKAKLKRIQFAWKFMAGFYLTFLMENFKHIQNRRV